jgi:hypothetical protein
MSYHRKIVHRLCTNLKLLFRDLRVGHQAYRSVEPELQPNPEIPKQPGVVTTSVRFGNVDILSLRLLDRYPGSFSFQCAGTFYGSQSVSHAISETSRTDDL